MNSVREGSPGRELIFDELVTSYTVMLNESAGAFSLTSIEEEAKSAWGERKPSYYQDRTMGSIRGSGYRLNLSDKNATEQTLKYIDHMASVVNWDISNWYPFQVFVNLRCPLGSLIHEKNEINRIFFETLEKTVKPEVLPSEKLPPVEMYRFRNLFERSDQLYQEASYRIRRNSEDRLLVLSQDIQIQASILEKCNLRQKVRPTAPEVYIQQVINLLAEGYWEMGEGTCPEYLEFVSPVVVLRYVNRAQASNITVPMGRFCLRIPLRLNDDNGSWADAAIHPYELAYGGPDKNVFVDSHYHPHVDSDGRICFGGSLVSYIKRRDKRDFEGVAAICRDILTNYCPENPYVYLHSFRDVIEGRDPSENEDYSDDDLNDNSDESYDDEGMF